MMGNFAENAIKKGFLRAWKDFPKQVKLPPVNQKCLSCDSKDICNTCCASRYAETGDLGGCPEYVYRDTKVITELLNRRK